jgi:hypothetical protein
VVPTKRVIAGLARELDSEVSYLDQAGRGDEDEAMRLHWAFMLGSLLWAATVLC